MKIPRWPRPGSGQKTKRLAGLALADDAWRWVSEGRVEQEALQASWVVNGLVQDFDPVAAALQRLMDRLKATTPAARLPTRVAMGLPSAAVLLHRTPVPPHLSETALLAWCHQQAAAWLPLPLADMVLDVYLEDPPSQTPSAWVGATRLERVQQVVSLAEAAGLTVCVLETESCAYRRAVHQRVWGTGVLPESVAGLALCLLAEESTQVQFVRLDSSGCALMEERSLAWGRRHWTPPSGSPPSPSQPPSGWCLPEVLQAVLMGFWAGQGLAPSFLGGDTAVNPSVAVLLSGRLPGWITALAPTARVSGMTGVLVQVFNPWLQNDALGVPPGAPLEAPSFTVAWGLAQPCALVPTGR